MVARMPRRREALQAEHAVADDVDVLLRHGDQLAPQFVERVSVETPSARLEPARIDEMRGADAGNVHPQMRVPAHEDARRARVVEVDVGKQEVTQVLEV